MSMARTAARRKRTPLRLAFTPARLKRDYPLYLLMLPPVLILLVYCYIPMLGIVIAFMKYLPAKGFTGSKWVGLNNFRTLFNMPGFYQALGNTVRISVWKIALNIMVPVIFTLMLNEMMSSRLKKLVQTVVYLPHFVSWILLSGIFVKLLAADGVVNKALGLLGIQPIIFLGDNRWFRPTMVITAVWKEFGYGTIVYLAAVAGVNQDLYEAAQIDGAGRWGQMWHVTLPAIVPIIVLMTTLNIGSILSAGFDQVFNLLRPLVYESGDILDTLVYRIGFTSGQFGLSTAASLFKSLISLVLILFSYRAAYKLTGYKVF